MRLLLKPAMLLLLTAVVTSSAMAAIHCADLLDSAPFGSASATSASGSNDHDCSFHANGANANLGSEKKIAVSPAKALTTPLSIGPALPAGIRVFTLTPASSPHALPLALSSILRI